MVRVSGNELTEDNVDGDEINYTLLLDDSMAKEFETLKPHYGVADLSKPFAISGNLSLLAPATSILSSYLYKNVEDKIEQDTISSQLNMVSVTV